MEDRIRFVKHEGKQILLVDISNCSSAQVITLSKIVRGFVTAHPKGSLLLLADFTNAEFDKESLPAMQETAVFDRPHLKKSAWVGTESLPNIFYEHIKTFSRRDLPTFKTREEALDWLVKE
jgi:hypothetical protein